MDEEVQLIVDVILREYEEGGIIKIQKGMDLDYMEKFFKYRQMFGELYHLYRNADNCSDPVAAKRHACIEVVKKILEEMNAQ